MKPIARAKAFRSDDRGQVVLLSGVMVFVVLMITIMTFDMSKAVYNRIIAQNSVDAAADAAALWQARGCNLLQHLNNVHYKVNTALFIAETAALTGCALSAIDIPAEYATRVLQGTIFAGIWVGLAGAANISCEACYFAPWIDWGQEKFATVVMGMQNSIDKVFPVLAFLYADVMAKQSGADDVIASAASYVGSIGQVLGIGASGLSDVSEELADGISSLPVSIYAFPLDPSSLKLHVERKAGTSLPWKWPDWAVDSAELAVNIAAPLCNNDTYVRIMPGKINPNKPKTWGWKDDFYWGNPGFMTWVAGKMPHKELLGLGKLTWLGAEDADSEQSNRDATKVMFAPGSVMDGSAELVIPAFLAIASSQVEGTPVISKGDADAKGKIIKVYFPPDANPKSGENVLIYH
ncbi:MAG: pilus assembly protein TadG-related protein [bacterium]